ncbi:hypothetical protein [Longirhabdus pacifica]|uniref:hypothetical protein n=1 Tax=Longirhabdus pacifica TaxID=2305227 RepID=UPI001008D377|nr:hypothetical protein [Longirhabdus pacifica]
MKRSIRSDFKKLIQVLQSEFKAVEMDHTKDEYILRRYVLLEDHEAERHSVHKDYKYMKCFKIEDPVVLDELFTAEEKEENEKVKHSTANYPTNKYDTTPPYIKNMLSKVSYGEMLVIFFGSDDGEHVDNMTTQGGSRILLSKLSKMNS